MATPCNCCWLLTVEVSVSDRDPYCKMCRGHLHSAINARADHRKITSSFVAAQREKVASLQATVATRDAFIVSMERDNADLVRVLAADEGAALSAELASTIHDASMEELQSKVESAYRTRDRAMSAVWRIDELHHEVTGEKCACGKAIRSCRDFAALIFFRSTYYGWERHQIELMQANKHHGLPRDHPKSSLHSSREFGWRGAPSTRPDERRGLSA